jgi:hypothetical protein
VLLSRQLLLCEVTARLKSRDPRRRNPARVSVCVWLDAAESAHVEWATTSDPQRRRDRRRKHLAGDYATEAVFLPTVRRVKIVAASALLAMWMPATSFCLAENAGLITKNGGCADCPSSQTSPCCALASAAYKLDDNGSGVVPCLGNSVSLFRDTIEVHPQLIVCLAGTGCESPPELRSSWQFCARAAANPRAPSSVS